MGFPARLSLDAQLRDGHWRGRLRATNEPSAVRRFAQRGATVTKMLGANHIAEENTRKITFTRPLGNDDLADLRGIRTTTHQFQRWAPKRYDCRVIAIGNLLFAFAIRAGNAASYIDFRADYDALTYESIELPSSSLPTVAYPVRDVRAGPIPERRVVVYRPGPERSSCSGVVPQQLRHLVTIIRWQADPHRRRAGAEERKRRGSTPG